jgi:ribosomal protein S18 acetylase RimI-like enzyme
MQFSIRRAAAGDEAALALVAQAVFLETFAGGVDGQDILAHVRDKCGEAYFRAALNQPASALWLAELAPGAAPIGYAQVTAPDLPVQIEAGDLELKRIYVLPRFHGTQIGRDLMDGALAFAREAGAPRLLIGVKADNNRALSFYRRLGFAEIGTRAFHVGANDYHDLILARPLS